MIFIVAARHVFAGLILRPQDHSADLKRLKCDGVFDPENDVPSVITELCRELPDADNQSLCTDEHQENLQIVLDRLRIKDLKEIGKKYRVKVTILWCGLPMLNHFEH